jgi:hypothetical protein
MGLGADGTSRVEPDRGGLGQHKRAIAVCLGHRLYESRVE